MHDKQAQARRVSSARTLPVVALESRVIFPGAPVRLNLWQAASRRAVEAAAQDGRVVALFTRRYDQAAAGKAMPELCDVGVLAELAPGQYAADPDRTTLVVRPRYRLKLLRLAEGRQFPDAQVAACRVFPPERSNGHWAATVRELRDAADRLVQLGVLAEFPTAVRDDPGALADHIAAGLPLDVAVQQDLLEECDVARRVRAVLVRANSELELTQLRRKIRRDLADHFATGRRREYLLGQLRVIRGQLGENQSEGERLSGALAQRLEAAGMPPVVRREVEPELRRLAQLQPSDAEFPVLADYLENLAELPWARMSDTAVSLPRLRSALDRALYDMAAVKQRIIEHLATRQRNPAGKFPVLCLWGPPGVGKRTIARTMAAALGRKYARLRLAGVQDDAEIIGGRRARPGTTPGRPVEELRKAGVRNPVLVLEGIDRFSLDCHGDPASALLQVIDPWVNAGFVDRFLNVPFDMSGVLFIATANHADDIPAVLRDRLELVRVSGYSDADKLRIARRYLVPHQLAEHGLTGACRIEDDVIGLLAHDYTREAGVRALDRCVGALCRHAVGKLGERVPREPLAISVATVAEVLGPPRYLRETKLVAAGLGVATGLAWTSVGGEIMHIEALRYPGNGQILLTGQIGSVMKESAQAALSLLKSRAAQLGIDGGTILNHDLHVHVPAGAVPKDGPSAGVSIFTAITSRWTGRAVRPDVAMTGEITLRGVVLAVGGLREKILAAQRAGIFKVIYPAQNEKDLVELPASVRRRMRFIPVTTVDEVLAAALRPARRADRSAPAKPADN
jgi:ATP-dependent Lon protease